MKCPECGKELGDGIFVDLATIGWVCVHPTYDLKIYKMGRDVFD